MPTDPYFHPLVNLASNRLYFEDHKITKLTGPLNYTSFKTIWHSFLNLDPPQCFFTKNSFNFRNSGRTLKMKTVFTLLLCVLAFFAAPALAESKSESQLGFEGGGFGPRFGRGFGPQFGRFGRGFEGGGGWGRPWGFRGGWGSGEEWG